MKSRNPLKINHLDRSPSVTPRPTYWNNLFHRLGKVVLVKDLYSKIQFMTLNEPEFAYNQLPLVSSSMDIQLNGYFQSYKYFEDNYDTIYNMIGFKGMKNAIREKISTKIDYDKCVSIHFRMGDYKRLPDCHPILDDEYYVRALNHLLENGMREEEEQVHVLFFCEQEDAEVVNERVKRIRSQLVRAVNFVQVSEQLEDWEQMLFMSMCHHNVIANSSYSWWAAYLNTHEDKQVYYPNIWFGAKIAQHNTGDMCPDNWHKIEAGVFH